MSIVSDPDVDVDVAELVGDEVCPWRDEEIVRTLYVDEELPDRMVGAILGCSKTTVWTWRMRHGIETQGHESSGGYPWHEEDEDDEDEDDTDGEYEGLKYMLTADIVEEIADEVGFDYDPDRNAQDQPAILRDDLLDILDYLDPEWEEKIGEDPVPGRLTRKGVMTRTEIINLIDRSIEEDLAIGSDRIVRDGLKTLHRIIISEEGNGGEA